MEWSILFMGPVGAGKTQAIQTISDIEVAKTEANATDETANLKPLTTVSMDAGVLELGGGDKVRLIGAPGQDRFNFMWDILLEQAKAVVVLVDHSKGSRLEDLEHYVKQVGERLGQKRLPLAIGVTHADKAPEVPINVYQKILRKLQPAFASGVTPVMRVDARNNQDVRTLVLGVAAMLEMEHRFGRH